MVYGDKSVPDKLGGTNETQTLPPRKSTQDFRRLPGNGRLRRLKAAQR